MQIYYVHSYTFYSNHIRNYKHSDGAILYVMSDYNYVRVLVDVMQGNRSVICHIIYLGLLYTGPD
jgi:hypothetical protein